MTDEGSGNTGNALLRYILRVERLEEEKRQLQADIAEIFKQAKGAGFDPKVMKAMIRERRMDADERAEWQALLDTYRATLGMLDGTPLGDAARKRFSKDEGREEPEEEMPPPVEPEALAPATADSVQAARAEGEAAAKAGTAIAANPYPAGDARRASWDEGWCATMGSDGMDIPPAFRRSKPKKEEGAGAPPPGGEG